MAGDAVGLRYEPNFISASVSGSHVSSNFRPLIQAKAPRQEAENVTRIRVRTKPRDSSCSSADRGCDHDVGGRVDGADGSDLPTSASACVLRLRKSYCCCAVGKMAV
jgi:hypothetical protein